MFLHSGASLHGHEYSIKRSTSAPLQPPRSLPILKSALRQLPSPSESSESGYCASLYAQDLHASRRASTDEVHEPQSLVLRQRAVSNSYPSKDLAVRFREPRKDQIHTSSASEGEDSIAGPELLDGCADAPMRRKKRRRLHRKSTRYALAQPAPQLRTKQRRLVQIRPRLLLQLQEIGDKRAIPAFDLIPSQPVAGALIIPKLSKRFPRMFHANAELSQNDVLLVRSEDYGSTSGKASLNSDEDRRSLHGRDICAVISALPEDCESSAEIVLEDGVPWYASPMANGSYEFTRTDDDGQKTTARWVRRSNVSTRNNGIAPFDPSSSARPSVHDSSPDLRWTFSIIDPSSRRHPVMGSLTSETAEVYDHYTTLSASSGGSPPTRPFGPEMDGLDRSPSPSGFSPESRATLEVLPEQKVLMVATASWIRLHQQGWPASANPKFAKSIPSHGRSASANMCSTSRRRTFPSYDGDNSRATSPTNLSRPSDSAHGPRLSRRPYVQRMPARAMSTGRAFMKRRSDRMGDLVKVYSQAPSRGVGDTEKLSTQQEEKMGCLSRVRQWTHKLFHRKRASVRRGQRTGK
ncbi:uncharacterized protein MAM_06310 [Metarhizium album ARSEF 1941]|uniref:Uncharacterized protein n=1 Tax=Metarhizium album (strain ARSEF 1941) TaxID=1081103 RepID=A0A0B2WPK5_METAS|nr:uncharacterized protein MAM_06310 [Metarhizium album ARSEF 1941]KHN95948.1 hypothetical protein MAM_06310 [Metarhizium album ARSEF 1941]